MSATKKPSTDQDRDVDTWERWRHESPNPRKDTQTITEQIALEKGLERRLGVPEGYSSVVECEANMCNAPGSIPSTARKDSGYETLERLGWGRQADMIVCTRTACVCECV